MRNRILSFGIALGVTAAVFAAWHVIKGQDDGRAYASPAVMGSEIRQGAEARIGGARDEIVKSISYNSEALLDLKGHDVISVLDNPGLVRRDAPTTIWQYRNDSCVLDLYFKASKDGDETLTSVEHYEIRAREKGVEDEAVQTTCVRDLVRAKNGFQMVSVSAVYKALAQ